MKYIYSWIGQFMGLLDRWTGNYVFALLLFALIIELLLLPFGIKQQKNSIKQAKLRPKEMAIQKKYAGRNDQATRQKVQQEIQELYQKENFNQFAGCLPLLIQLPILIILYYVVINPLGYELGVSAGAISSLRTFITTAVEEGGLGMKVGGNAKSTIELIDLLKTNGLELIEGLKTTTLIENGEAVYNEIAAIMGKLPNLTVFGMNLGLIPTISEPSWLWSIPVLTFAVYFGSMKLNRKLSYQPTTAQSADMGCSNNIMDVTMPMMSVVITFAVPAAVGVYWIFKSILGTVKQFILFKAMPMPQFTEEDYKAAEREMAGKNPPKKSSGGGVSKSGVRSLHHIDDDDYLPPVKKEEPKKKQAPKTEDAETAEAGSDDAESKTEAPAEPVSPIEEAPLKDDRPERKSDDGE